MPENSSHNANRRFGGVERLYGNAALSKFKQAHVIVIGIGGVGSWAVEALARNAVGRLTLIDMDVVAESNINRQLPAMTSTLGKNKIDVMAERIREINPDCEVNLIDNFVSQDNIAELIDDSTEIKPDYVIDCIDNSRVKAALIAWCKRRKIKIITLGGAGGQTKLLRQNYNFTNNVKRRFAVPCVFSSEHLKYITLAGEMSQDKPASSSEVTDLSCAGGIGSSVMVTASFAFIAVSYVLDKIAQN